MVAQMDGFVYFIHDPSQGAVKIGWTGVGIGQRLRAFNDTRAYPNLYIVGLLPGTVKDERPTSWCCVEVEHRAAA